VAGILGDAWRAPKVGRCRVEYGMGGCPLPSRIGCSGKRVSSRSRVRGSGRKRILAYLEGHKTFLFVPHDKIWGEQFALTSPTPNAGGLSPRPPWSTPMRRRVPPPSIFVRSVSKANVPHFYWSPKHPIALTVHCFTNKITQEPNKLHNFTSSAVQMPDLFRKARFMLFSLVLCHNQLSVFEATNNA